jgi:hypothetical protein
MENFPKIAYAAVHGFEDDSEMTMFENPIESPGFLEDGQEIAVYELKEVKRIRIFSSLEDL